VTLHHLIADESTSCPDISMYQTQLRESLRGLIAEVLSPQEQTIIAMRFGLNETEEDVSVIEIGAKLGVGRNCGPQTIGCSMAKIRAALQGGKKEQFAF